MPSVIGPPDRTFADRLGLTVREFQRYRSQGIVKVDIQVSDGCTHITCVFGNRIWEAMMELGTITKEDVRYLRGPSAQSPG